MHVKITDKLATGEICFCTILIVFFCQVLHHHPITAQMTDYNHAVIGIGQNGDSEPRIFFATVIVVLYIECLPLPL
jgi:hypothetical protein